jgi:Domain of unknown function (DUF4878)
MKKAINYFCLAVVALTIGSCTKTPTIVTTEAFLAALSKGDFELAKTMVTKETEPAIETLLALAPDQVKGKKYSIIKEVVIGDNATVTYKEEGQKEEKTIRLVKINGTWKVEFDKNEFTGTYDQFKQSIGDFTDSLGNAFVGDTALLK